MSADEITESRVLLGWCSTFHHWKCRESFMRTETNRITCTCGCHAPEVYAE